MTTTLARYTASSREGNNTWRENGQVVAWGIYLREALLLNSLRTACAKSSSFAKQSCPATRPSLDPSQGQCRDSLGGGDRVWVGDLVGDSPFGPSNGNRTAAFAAAESLLGTVLK